jgi:protein-disulfide isomerase
MRSGLFVAVLLAALGAGCSDNVNAKPEPGSSAKGSASASASAASVKPTGFEDAAMKKLDVGALTAREKGELSAQLGQLLAPCEDTPVSLAQCVAEDRACKACVPAAQILGKLVRLGATKKDLEAAHTALFDPKSVKEVPLEGSPSKGPDDAPLTIVEWADFECPACKALAPLLDILQDRFPGQVRVIYKFYPLTTHKNGFDAARAAVAAQNQGKFWEMHEALFLNQGKLERQDLQRIAKKVGLDSAQFSRDFGDDATKKRVEREMQQAESLGLEGTPMIYVNGRKADLAIAGGFDLFEAWLVTQIELAGKKPNPPNKKFEDFMAEVRAMSSASAAPGPSGSAPPPALSVPKPDPK